MLGRKKDSLANANVENLKRDASQVLDNLTDLSRRLAEAGRERTCELAKDVSEHLEEDLEKLRQKLDVLNKELQTLGKSVDSHVRSNPYLYVMGALGAGAILGKIFRSRRSA